MGRRSQQKRRIAWKLAAWAGALSSSVSTLFIILSAPRLGKPVALSWMEVAMVLLGRNAIRLRPRAREYLAGVAVHQFADFAWAMAFFGIGARWTQRLRTKALLGLALPWAFITSAIEYFLILPWLQPWLRMQSPYWINLGAHIASSVAYPLFPWLRRLYGGGQAEDVAASRVWASILGGLAGLLGSLALLGRMQREVRWPFGTSQARQVTQSFLQHMTAHHQIGVRLLRLAVERGERTEFRKLNELMLAQHIAEIELMCRWWRSWYGSEMPAIGPATYKQMAGMPAPARIKALEAQSGLAFESAYLPTMIFHHAGAIRMAKRAWLAAHDPRIWLFADQIRHTQRGQIKRMQALLRALPAQAEAKQAAQAGAGADGRG